MCVLNLPFWLLVGNDSQQQAVAFTNVDKLAAFLTAEGPGRWNESFVEDSDGLLLAIAEVHGNGATVVWLNPTAGTAVEDSVRLVDLMELRNRLGAA